MQTEWPNKVTITLTAGPHRKYREGIGKVFDLTKWCEDSLSSKGVLWEKSSLMGKSINFYFAQSQDAVLFRLVNGV